MQKKEIGSTGIQVTPLAMGCWPIAGVTTIDVTNAAAVQTLRAAYDGGINFFDTAFAYGFKGESEKYIAEALGDVRSEIVLATKGGYHWVDGKHAKGASPTKLTAELDTSLNRLQTEYVDLYYLHGPDPECPIEKSAEVVATFLAEGKIKSAGLCNATLEEIKRFHAICPLSAFQTRYNLLQREVEDEILPWCQANHVSLMGYWPLMKGLLAGHLKRDHQFDERDSRRNYPIYQGEEWEKNQDLVDRLREVANQVGKTVVQVVLNWTMCQTGMTSVLCGARKPEQIIENAHAAEWTLSDEQLNAIAKAIEDREQRDS